MLADGSNLTVQYSNGGPVEVLNSITREVMFTFDPKNANKELINEKVIYDSDKLNNEEKCLLHFWIGFFYAMAGGE